MKLIKLIMTFIFLATSPILSYIEEFDKNINEAYDKYYTYIDYTTPEYSLKIVRGIVNGEESYGLCFYSVDAKKYEVAIKGNDSEYTFKSDTNRGDIAIYAFDPIADGYIVIYNEGKEVSLPDKYNVSTFTESDLENITISNGENRGCDVTKPNKNSNNVFPILFFAISFIIIIICLFTILVFYMKKKGKFDDEIKKEDVFDFKKFISENIKEEPIEVEAEVINDNYNDIDEKPREVNDYGNNKRLYEDEPSGFIIKDYLRDKGYITIYASLSESEKNSIMLELMHLRDDGKITKDEYIMEVSELWRK